MKPQFEYNVCHHPNASSDYCVLNFKLKFNDDEVFNNSVALFRKYILELPEKMGKSLLYSVLEQLISDFISKFNIDEVDGEVQIDNLYIELKNLVDKK